MADLLVLELVDKGLVTDQITLTIGYDVTNLAEGSHYQGDVVTDRYGRRLPKHAHGTANRARHTASTRLILQAVEPLYDRSVDPALLIRRLNITANHIVEEASLPRDSGMQLDFFSGEDAAETEAGLARERRMQQAMLTIKKKYGKNAILKGMNLEEGATARDRNRQIGGHKA